MKMKPLKAIEEGFNDFMPHQSWLLDAGWKWRVIKMCGEHQHDLHWGDRYEEEEGDSDISAVTTSLAEEHCRKAVGAQSIVEELTRNIEQMD